MASNTQLSPESVSYLLDKRVSSVGSNYIVLDNGWRIYLEEDEIEYINAHNEPDNEA